MNNEYLSLREAAEYIGISYRTAGEDWPKWTKFGVKPIRYLGKERGNLKFKRNQLDEMMERSSIIVR